MPKEKKHVLIYAHYFYPDVASTGQILAELAEGLLVEFKVTVICVVPSYDGHVEEKYKIQKFYYEKYKGVNIIRIRVPEFTKINKSSRIKNILSYYIGACKATRMVGNVDYVFTISQPPILGGLLGVYGKKKLKAKMIYNIQDFNPEQIEAVNYINSKIIINIAREIDKYSCIQSDLIVTVGRDLVKTVEKRFQNAKMPKTVLINNWIDESIIYPIQIDNEKIVKFKEKYCLENKFVIMYSGNIGLYYDLEKIMQVIEKYPKGTKYVDGREVVFAFVGDGSKKQALIEYVSSNNIENVDFIPYQPKEELIYSLNAADVHWCVNAKGIKGVSCPSKGYGIMAVGKPIIGVLEEGSEIRCLIEESKCGICCEPGDYHRIKEIIDVMLTMPAKDLEMMGSRGRKFLEGNLTKHISIKKYVDVIHELGE